MRLRLRLSLFGSLLLAGPALAQDAAAWLARMGEAVRGLDYHGDLVYAHAGQLETLRLFHASGPDSERERLVTLSGAPREVIRSGGRVTCLGTGDQPSTYGDPSTTPRLLATLPGSDPMSLAQNYALVLGGTERIADRETQRLEIRPRDAFRYGYQLWLDQATGMPLKSVRFGADGRPVEQLMFTRIVVGERPSDRDLSGSEVAAISRGALELPRESPGQMPGWSVVDPPAGFVLALQQPPNAEPGDHLVYSDGIANVSVYIEPIAQGIPVFSGPARRGALHLYGRIMDGRQITVLGDVPAATVERFAQSVAAPEDG
jgi:sigma-E factor negative regulatory protein RseB